MCGVTLLCVGKLKERWYREAAAEYEKRLGAFCKYQCIEVPELPLGERPSERELAAALEREAEALEKKIPPGAVTVAFCVEGSPRSSEGMAAWLGGCLGSGKSSLCFLIGGSNGLAERVKARAELRLSVSPMTFPHHLFRVMALEQLYRSFSILEGLRYHK